MYCSIIMLQEALKKALPPVAVENRDSCYLLIHILVGTTYYRGAVTRMNWVKMYQYKGHMMVPGWQHAPLRSYNGACPFHHRDFHLQKPSNCRPNVS